MHKNPRPFYSKRTPPASRAGEMHVVGRIRSAVLQAPRLRRHGLPVQFYKRRPGGPAKVPGQPDPADA
jgi:hypothetical protein